MRYWVFAIALLTASCGSTIPMGSAESDQVGKQFTSPPAGRAAIYVFSSDRGGTRGGPPFDMSLDQRQLGTVAKGKWLRADVPPGTHDIRCYAPGLAGTASQIVEMPPGSITFVSASYIFFGEPPCRLTVESSADGRKAIQSGSRIREIGGASD